MVLPDSRRVSRVPRYSGAVRSLDNFAYGPLTLSGAPFQTLRLSSTLPLRRSYNPGEQALRFGLFPLRSPLLGESRFLSLPWVLRCFSSPSIASNGLFYSSVDARVFPGGLPHSEISGSKLVYSSPKLIAVSHVLLRLLTPRHSPFALSSFTLSS